MIFYTHTGQISSAAVPIQLVPSISQAFQQLSTTRVAARISAMTSLRPASTTPPLRLADAGGCDCSEKPSPPPPSSGLFLVLKERDAFSNTHAVAQGGYR